VWPLRTEDPRLAPAGTSVRKAFVGSRARSAHLILQSKGVSMATEVRSAGSTEDPHLRRELHLWEAVGISLALMAPSMAANINPQGTASTIGRAVPLAFALATIGVLLIAWTFVRLTQRFNHAGSVYGFVGASLGPRAGVVSGWALMGPYTFYGVVTATASGIFGADFLDSLGIWTDQPVWAPYAVGAVAFAGVWALAASNIRGGPGYCWSSRPRRWP
jgi:amino acid transporter